MPEQTLTYRLLQGQSTRELYTRSTQSAFLSLAGQGRLPKGALSQWLAQDRLYAQAYLRFIGCLISRLRLPTAAPAVGTLEWRVLGVLNGALTGIITELQFFEKTARAYGLDLTAATTGAEAPPADTKGSAFGPNKVTQAYISLFDSFGPGSPEVSGSVKKEKSLLEGLVLLWATEKVYLDAWSYAKEEGAVGMKEGEEDLDGGALRTEFIPNWTSDAFRQFVMDIQECLDEYAAKQGDDEVHDDAAAVWKEVLELEEGFWPKVNLKDVSISI
ncbi:hypothetical protein BX600DRAFT_193361 [Xylariales sp. PMI_506]|nr:hypothetical protein BX600DRAFT_193361 [Xylariales sp. PMI_506]